MANILIATMGSTADIVIESVGLINHSKVDIYSNSPRIDEINRIRNEKFLGKEVDELWILTTDSLKDEDVDKIKSWNLVNTIRYFVLKGVTDIVSQAFADQCHDMVLRVVKNAQKQKGSGGNLWLSLAGGRKTMSSDLQDAAYCFGCDEVFHVIGDGKVDLAFSTPMSEQDANKIKIVTLGRYESNPALENMEPEHFDDYKDILYVTPSEVFLNEVQKKKEESQFFYSSYYLDTTDRTNFPLLYTLSPKKIDYVKNYIIGADPAKREQEMDLLRKLPKIELHCHFGGILDTKGLVRVASTYKKYIEDYRNKNKLFDEWCKQACLAYKEILAAEKNNWKTYCEGKAQETGVNRVLINAFILICFTGKEDVLDNLWFEEYINEDKYFKIGITAYERLGDLQGSMLFQTPEAIDEAMKILKEYALAENLVYLELRCSPLNYTKFGMNAKQVIRQICNGLQIIDKGGIAVSMLIIASRHGKEEDIKKNVELACKMNDQLFSKYFRGFDVAGNESMGSPSKLRPHFESALRECRSITIHAGETMNADSIWDAVYSLNAERIGHGLTLIDDSPLKTKFLDRQIGIEMCPSSNYQIVGFADNYYLSTVSDRQYPLYQYLNDKLPVCVNTDNPGISRTTSSNELHRAARLTRNGLSLWNIFQLIYNGLLISFLPYSQKRDLIKRVEETIGKLFKKEMI
ncbi:MAG: hypothetical protein HUJ92_04925 [Bacteroidales bacterium]|nr:hypothetical protein [Bacteroidales bacterium]